MNKQKIINQKLNYITILKQIGGTDVKIQEMLASIDNMKKNVETIGDYINKSKEINKIYQEQIKQSTELFNIATEAFTDTEEALQELNKNIKEGSKFNIADMLKDIEIE